MSALPRLADGLWSGPERADPKPSSRSQETYVCDVCGRTHQGPPAGAGLFVWTRGDEVRYEEPPLCEECANRVTVAALALWDCEEEE